MDGVRMISVIETTLTRRGDGENTPVRVIRQYWSPDGQFLAEVDPCPDHVQSIKVLTDAVLWALQTDIKEFRQKGQRFITLKDFNEWRTELRRRAHGMLPKAEEPATDLTRGRGDAEKER